MLKVQLVTQVLCQIQQPDHLMRVSFKTLEPRRELYKYDECIDLYSLKQESSVISYEGHI